MTILTDESLEFAKDHIQKFYDTDFYPKPFEFEAIWHCWSEVKNELTSRNVYKMAVTPPRALPWKKPKGGYRIVHQLEPIDSIIYVALIFQVADRIENARAKKERDIACAYRIDVSDGSLFSSGSGYDRFREASKELALSYKYVLQTDITDFYNQLYLHRLNNAIEHADPVLKSLADDIEHFLTALNQKASQGVPVGPAASIVMAEATLIDVDQYLVDLGVKHTRYVDDFRIFSDDLQELERVLQDLTLYLYANHRLTLAAEKTHIKSSEKFAEQLENPYEIEKIQVFEEIEVLNPYTQETIDVLEFQDEEKTRLMVIATIVEALKKLTKQPLDLGFSRALVRQAKIMKIHDVIDTLLDHFEFFLPIANNVILYLNDVTDVETLPRLTAFFSKLTKSELMANDLARLWIEWYLTNHREFLEDPEIRAFLYGSPNIITQARAAVLENNLSWIRKNKSSFLASGPWERRAILLASQILPTDERNAWVKQAMLATPYVLDQWVGKWIIEKDDEDLVPF